MVGSHKRTRAEATTAPQGGSSELAKKWKQKDKKRKKAERAGATEDTGSEQPALAGAQVRCSIHRAGPLHGETLHLILVCVVVFKYVDAPALCACMVRPAWTRDRFLVRPALLPTG